MSSIYEGAYAGALVGYNSYSIGDQTDEGGTTSETIGGATFGGVFGYRSEVGDGVFLGLETFVNSNSANRTYNVLNADVKLSADISYGISATAGFAIDKSLLFMSAGYGWNDVSIKSVGLADNSVSDSGKGVRLGAGIEFPVTNVFSVRVQGDWQDFGFESSALGASTGIIFHF